MTAALAYWVAAVIALAVVAAVAVEHARHLGPLRRSRPTRLPREPWAGSLDYHPVLVLPPAPDRWPLPDLGLEVPTVRIERPHTTQPIPVPWEAPW